MKVQPWAAATAAFAAGSLAAVGIAQATSAPTKIPDSSTGVITACMVKKTGAVRFINAQAGKTCTSKEKKVTFNNQGPAGAPGTPGAVGATGPAGPSKTTVKARDTAKEISEFVVIGGNNVIELTLPAGDYTFTATGSIGPTNGSTKAIECRVDGPTGSSVKSNEVSLDSNANLPNGTLYPIAVTGTYSNTAEAKLILTCFPSDEVAFPSLAGEGRVVGATMTATKVGELAVQ